MNQHHDGQPDTAWHYDGLTTKATSSTSCCHFRNFQLCSFLSWSQEFCDVQRGVVHLLSAVLSKINSPGFSPYFSGHLTGKIIFMSHGHGIRCKSEIQGIFVLECEAPLLMMGMQMPKLATQPVWKRVGPIDSILSKDLKYTVPKKIITFTSLRTHHDHLSQSICNSLHQRNAVWIDVASARPFAPLRLMPP